MSGLRGSGIPADSAPRPAALVALAVLVGLEALGLAVVTVLIVVLTITQHPTGSGLTSSIALAVTAAIVAAGLAFVALGLYRAQPWTRAATLVWQLVQVLVGAYSFQPPGARPDLGTLLIAPALVALVLLFRRSVRAATTRR